MEINGLIIGLPGIPIERGLRKLERYKPLRTIQEALEELRKTELVKEAVVKPKKRKEDVRTTRRKWREHWHERADPGRLNRSSLRHHFHKLRHHILHEQRLGTRGKCWEWTLTMDEWMNMWLACPAVNAGYNVMRPAWTQRGKDKKKDVQLRRIDTNKGYEINNLQIWHGQVRIWPEEAK